MTTERMLRDGLRNKQRIVIKIGSSSLTHPATGRIDLVKMEILVRELVSLQAAGKDVVLVSSGAIMAGRQSLGLDCRPNTLALKQACASIGQARLMMIYQKLFSEYNAFCSQILMTKNTIMAEPNRTNASNTFEELLSLGVVPIVNENDTISTSELVHLDTFGDNDTLSAVVASLIHADLLILLSDIDGLFTDDPGLNPEAEFLSFVEDWSPELESMAKDAVSGVGTGGMSTKIKAARIAGGNGIDMLIANGSDFHNIHRIVEGFPVGTLFQAHPDQTMRLEDYFERY